MTHVCLPKIKPTTAERALLTQRAITSKRQKANGNGFVEPIVAGLMKNSINYDQALSKRTSTTMKRQFEEISTNSTFLLLLPIFRRLLMIVLTFLNLHITSEYLPMWLPTKPLIIESNKVHHILALLFIA